MKNLLKKSNLKILRQILQVALFSMVLTSLIGSGTARAITENNSYVPKNLKDIIYVTNRQTPGGPKPKPAPANACGNNYNNFQQIWSSQDLNSKVSEDLSVTPLELQQFQDTANLRLNLVGGYCDSIISRTSNGTGVITDKTLNETHYTVKGDSSGENPQVSINGGAYKSTGVTVSGIKEGDEMRISYQKAQDNNRRWAKQADEYPFHRSYQLNGLKAITSTSGDFTLNIRIPVHGVNYFPGGYNYDKNNKYVCVSNDQNSAQDLQDSSNNCEASYIYAKLSIHVSAALDATCFITKINSTTIVDENTTPVLTAGQNFSATYTVHNGGTSGWDLRDTSADKVYLKSNTGNNWGSGTVSLNGKGDVLSGAALQSGSNIENYTAPNNFKVPSTASGELTFSWVVHKDGTNGGDISKPCFVKIHVINNRPFLRVSGGDTVAGATFSYLENGTEISENSRDKAYLNAQIQTNGYKYNTPYGSSSTEYAAIASGFIGHLSPNNFYSHNQYIRPDAETGVGDKRDLSFANDTDNYGKFYGDNLTVPDVLPSINISELVEKAKAHYNYSVHNSGPARTEFMKYLTGDNGSAYFEAKPKGLRNLYGTTGPVTVTGSKVIVVDSDLRINNNIVYADGAPRPNLIVIALGDIYVNENVDRMDGTYIAFPVNVPGDEDKGIFDTCTNDGSGSTLYGGSGFWPGNGDSHGISSQVCQKQLVINGRVIARKVYWKRGYGALGPSDSVLPGTSCVYSESQDGLNRCAAERIDFSPEAYFNSPFGNETTSNVSNVPQSTKDLPPVY